MNPRVARLSQIVKSYEGTSVGVKVGVREKEGKLQLAIGGRNLYDTAGRRVQQLKHAVSQFGIPKHEKTSYEGEKLKRFVQEHGGKDLAQRLVREGVFRETITYGKLQTIAQALEKEGKASSTEAEKTMSHPLEKKNAENEPPPVVAPSPRSPKAQAKQNWLNRNIKKERARSREKAFLNAQRGIFYGDLGPEEQASLKVLAQGKQASLHQDTLAIKKKQYSKEVPSRQAVEQHSFPDIVTFLKDTEGAQPSQSRAVLDRDAMNKTILEGFALVDNLRKSAKNIPLEYQDKVGDWLNATYEQLGVYFYEPLLDFGSEKVDLIQTFYKKAQESVDAYSTLANTAADATVVEKELKALGDGPMDGLIQTNGLSEASKSFLLQELAHFTSKHPGLEPLDAYGKFVSHLNSLVTEEDFSSLSAETLKEAADRQDVKREETIVAQQLEKFLAPLSQEATQFVKNILQNPAHKAQFQSSLMDYANKRNQAIEPIFTKIMSIVVRPDLKEDPNYVRWLRHEILPRVVNQTLSSVELRKISLVIAGHEVLKSSQFEGLKTFQGQDEDLKTLLERAITTLQPNLQRKEAVVQDLLDQWYQFRENSKAERYIDERQITGFLDHLAESYKNDISILEDKKS